MTNFTSALINDYTKEILSKISAGKKYTRFSYAQLKNDIMSMGSVNAVKRFLYKEMISHPCDYTKLYLDGKTQYMIESAVIDPKYQNLFSVDEVVFCEQFFLPNAA